MKIRCPMRSEHFLVEVAPGPRGNEWDANVGARVLYKLIGCALRTRY